MNIFPTFNGVYAIADKKAVLGFVNDKAFHFQEIYSNNLKAIYHKKILFLRGLEFLIFGMILFLKGIILSICKDRSSFKFSKSISQRLNISYVCVFSFVCLILAIIFATLLFGLLPSYLALVFVKINISILLRNFILACVKAFLLFFIFFVLKYASGFNRIYTFNYACNQVSNTNNNGFVAKNFLNFCIFGFILSLFMITFLSVEMSIYLRFGYNLLIFLTVFSIVFELLVLIDKSNIGFLAKVFCFLSIKSESNQTALLVARSVYWECKMIENSIDQDRKMSVVLAYVQNKLLQFGIDSPKEAQWLVAGVLGKNVNDLIFISSISNLEEQSIKRVLERRVKGEPLDKIFGEKDFYGLKFKVNRYCLSPRFETELLAEQVILQTKGKKLKILDLCTGSGAIAIAVKVNSCSDVVASDISENALILAKENAKHNNAKIKFVKSDLFEHLNKKQKYDIIVSNPPYIPTENIEKLDKEVKDYDPKIALDGGDDGLEFYRVIAQQSADYLKDDGKLFLEIGIGQASAVVKLLKKCFTEIKIINDYNNIERIIIAKKKGKNDRKDRKHLQKI